MVPSLFGARILIVEDNPAMTRLLEAAILDAGGTVVGLASDFASALELIEDVPVAGVLLALYVNGVRCDQFTAELTRRSIPFAVTAGFDWKMQPQTPADIKHFQIKYPMELLKRSLRLHGLEFGAGLGDDKLQPSRVSDAVNERMAS